MATSLLGKITKHLRNDTVKKAGFWSLLFFIFSLSSIGLLTFLISDQAYRQNLTSSAYTAGMTNITDINHYISKFGFYKPTGTNKISGSDFSRLKAMVPFAFAGADNFNRSFNTTVEPEIIVWWSYAEGINGRISFSNCNDRVYSIGNCYHPSSWQLGYGIQFSAIGLLEKAFSDMHGNPQDAALVQRVGQGVLNIDRANNTSPRCGGYSCTFPKMTIPQIMAGVSTSHETTNNWWASVLSRDPGINAYINAEALQVKRFNRQIAWGWGSYYRTHWQQYSNDLQTILVNWKGLGGCSAQTNCFGPSPTPTPGGLSFLLPTDTPTPTQTPTPKLTVIPTDTPTPTDTPVPTNMPVPTDTPTPTAVSPTFIAEDVTPTDTPTEVPTESPTQTPTPTDVPQEIPSISIAPIAGVATTPVSPPTPTPQPSVLVADQRVNRALGTVSVAGLLFVLLFAIPLTRKKIIFYVKKLLGKEKKQPLFTEGESVTGTFFVKKGSDASHVSLTNDSGTVKGIYEKGEMPNGFVIVTGTRKSDGTIVISEFQPAENQKT